MPTPRTGKANNEKAERNKRVHTELGDRLADERRSAERAYWQDQEQLADEIRRGLKLSGLTKDPGCLPTVPWALYVSSMSASVLPSGAFPSGRTDTGERAWIQNPKN